MVRSLSSITADELSSHGCKSLQRRDAPLHTDSFGVGRKSRSLGLQREFLVTAPLTSFDYTYSADGEEVSLKDSSLDECIQSCRDAPQFHGKSEVDAGASAEGSTEEKVTDCVAFCQGKFNWRCFPGNATVIAHNRGRVRLADLALGDVVLTASCSSSRCSSSLRAWTLRFDTVTAFLHADSTARTVMRAIRHKHGCVTMSPCHLLLVSPSVREAQVFLKPAADVATGEALVVPWMDGSCVLAEVIEASDVSTEGLYAPLLSSGTVLVDGVVASCYAFPAAVQQHHLFRALAPNRDCTLAHCLAHSVMLTVCRGLDCCSALKLPSAKLEDDKLESSKPKSVGSLHSAATALCLSCC
mmetsp:Transcript_47898/g.113831  ORF Transcript_47898/g.113831 Transcript_47898/m.113831 type:complete len:356 (-) Transcript_47898:15-1082(-)